MTTQADRFFEKYPMYERKDKSEKPVLDLAHWGLFPAGEGFEMANGIMVSYGHPYIKKGQVVAHTSVIFDKTIEEDGTIVCETVNSVYRLVGESAEAIRKKVIAQGKMDYQDGDIV